MLVPKRFAFGGRFSQASVQFVSQRESSYGSSPNQEKKEKPYGTNWVKVALQPLYIGLPMWSTIQAIPFNDLGR